LLVLRLHIDRLLSRLGRSRLARTKGSLSALGFLILYPRWFMRFVGP
jgi:hypothetical protein